MEQYQPSFGLVSLMTFKSNVYSPSALALKLQNVASLCSPATCWHFLCWLVVNNGFIRAFSLKTAACCYWRQGRWVFLHLKMPFCFLTRQFELHSAEGRMCRVHTLIRWRREVSLRSLEISAQDVDVQAGICEGQLAWKPIMVQMILHTAEYFCLRCPKLKTQPEDIAALPKDVSVLI